MSTVSNGTSKLFVANSFPVCFVNYVILGRGGGGGVGERRGFPFPIPAPNSRVCLKGSAKNARKIMVCTENADQNIPERFRASEVIFKTFIAWL